MIDTETLWFFWRPVAHGLEKGGQDVGTSWVWDTGDL